jgi:hypothetical protein
MTRQEKIAGEYIPTLFATPDLHEADEHIK